MTTMKHQWRKSSYSASQNGCVEIRLTMSPTVGVRDSKLGETSPVLTFSRKSFAAFLAGR